MISQFMIIHNPCNEETRYYRNYNLFWDELTEALKKNILLLKIDILNMLIKV